MLIFLRFPFISGRVSLSVCLVGFWFLVTGWLVGWLDGYDGTYKLVKPRGVIVRFVFSLGRGSISD